MLARDIAAGASPVTVTVADLIRDSGGRTVGIAPWDIPQRGEPVLLDGDLIEWQGIEPLLHRAGGGQPRRIEDAANGVEISFDEARLWTRGGTGVRTVRSIAGSRGWYLALETDTRIAGGTAYHLSIYETRLDTEPVGVFTALIDGPSGPVALSLRDRSVALAGQYTYDESALEIEIERSALESILEEPFSSEASFDLASARRIDARMERFTIGSVALREILR
jgi:hypothetical protein